MTPITQTPGNQAEERTALACEPRTGAVRKPTIDCPVCAGRGETYGYGTNDPSEKPKWRDCEECGGSGEVPEPEMEEEE